MTAGRPGAMPGEAIDPGATGTAFGRSTVGSGKLSASSAGEGALHPDRGAPTAGDTVEILTGKNRGAKGILVAIGQEPTPAGFRVMIAAVKLPRAGVRHVFAHDIRKV